MIDDEEAWDVEAFLTEALRDGPWQKKDYARIARKVVRDAFARGVKAERERMIRYLAFRSRPDNVNEDRPTTQGRLLYDLKRELVLSLMTPEDAREAITSMKL